MHLDHKIPWNLLASHLAYKRQRETVTPRREYLSSRHRPNEANDLNHFVRVLASTIREFSDTERAKHPPAKDLPKSGKLFDDSVLTNIESTYNINPYRGYSRMRHPLSADFQDEDYWVRNGCDGDMASAVKMLLAANQMPGLLRLANNPRVDVGGMNRLSGLCGINLSYIITSALGVYLLANVVAAIKFNAVAGSGAAEMSLIRLDTFRAWASWGLTSMDFPEQNIPHWAFWSPRGVRYPNVEDGSDPLLAGGEGIEALRDYMKTCFELLYRYDVIMRECGVEIDWIYEIVLTMRMNVSRTKKIDFGGLGEHEREKVKFI